MAASGRTLVRNRKARFDYEILETFEAGLVLTGSEIKAVRDGRMSLQEAYARPEGGELWLMGAHVAQHSAGMAAADHDPTRPKKLLLHKGEIARLSKMVEAKGLTLIPLRVYLKRHLAKVELGLARGRKRHDKRRALVDRYREREAREASARL